MKYFILIIFVCFIACTTTETVVETSNKKNETSQVDSPEVEVLEIDLTSHDKNISTKIVDGYRVKVEAVESISKAEEIKKTLTSNLNINIYVEYLIDKYYIYAGDCLTKEDAELLKNRISSLGFTKLYVFPKKVNVPDHNESAISSKEYTVSVFSSNDYKNAVRVKDIVEKRFKSETMIIEKGAKFVLICGKFSAERDADDLRNRIVRELGLTSAETIIFDGFIEYELRDIETPMVEPKNNDLIHEINEHIPEVVEPKFAIQIFATSDDKKAENLKSDLINQYSYSFSNVRSSGISRVFALFNEESEAREALTTLKKKHPDAFFSKISEDEATISTETELKKDKKVTNIVESGSYFVQIGAFSTMLSAEQIEKIANNFGYTNIQIIRAGKLYKVLVGGYLTREDAVSARDDLKAKSLDFENAWIVTK
ncbi:MAG: SPOR domain-containing protein [Candidatus Delongbacteria bacterium]|nr:SPOR domain-containing protein [Candidatus Delongbacteria bacterium]MBN2833665.1 SPOR domain-containing protein [Candidatus Delongbacteria bacterium]